MDFRTDKLLHGGDYNPEQWLKRPDILAKDIDMLEESGCNVVSLGFSPGPHWNRKKAYLTSDGCRKLLISFTKEESQQFLQHLQVQDRNGWLINIRKCFV